MQLSNKILRKNVANLVLSHETPFVDRLHQIRNMPSLNETRNMLSISTRRQRRRESMSFRRTVRIISWAEFSITDYQCCGSVILCFLTLGYGIRDGNNPDLGSEIRNKHPEHISESLVQVVCVKNTCILCCGSG